MESGFIVEVGAVTQTESVNPDGVAVFGTGAGVVDVVFEEPLPQAQRPTEIARNAIAVKNLRIPIPRVDLIQPGNLYRCC
jgi:hypothetical protein